MYANEKQQKLLNELKTPNLNMIFDQYENEEFNIDSHLGGYPFITSTDLWPTCKDCGKKMNFFMQLREVKENKEIVLKVMYRCDCKLENFEPVISVFEYHNPNLENGIKRYEGEKKYPFVEIKLDPSWSVPNWILLPYFNQELYKDILKMFNDSNELAEDYYDALRWNENYIATEPYSIVRGYPEYVSNPKLFKCHCCKQPTDLVFQLDSEKDFELDWNNGILYCYQCKTTGTLYFIIN